MSIRVGRLHRHEDVHGVSGTGEHIAEVFESSDGICIVRWLGANGSTNVYAGVKNVQNIHGHGGKTEIDWIWTQEPDPDPMEAIFDKKIAEAGGSTGTSPAPTGSTAVNDEAEKDAEADAIAEEIVEEAAEAVERVAGKLAEKLSAKTAERVAKKAAEKATVQDEPAEE